MRGPGGLHAFLKHASPAMKLFILIAALWTAAILIKCSQWCWTCFTRRTRASLRCGAVRWTSPEAAARSWSRCAICATPRSAMAGGSAGKW